MMREELHTRIAEHLGWSMEDVRAFSLPTLRDALTMKEPRSKKLEYEITCAIQSKSAPSAR